MDTFWTAFTITSLFAGIALGFLSRDFIQKSKFIQIWKNRADVHPAISQRFRSAQKSVFLYGLTFEGTFNSNKDDLVATLQNGAEVKILMLSPKSKHIEGHREFADRVLEPKFEENIDIKLKNLYFGSLTKEQRTRLTVKATNYWPRFSANIWDDENLYLNFYLYGSSASDNPVILINAKRHANEYNKIIVSLHKLFNDKDNIVIAEHGNWHGLDKTELS